MTKKILKNITPIKEKIINEAPKSCSGFLKYMFALAKPHLSRLHKFTSKQLKRLLAATVFISVILHRFTFILGIDKMFGKFIEEMAKFKKSLFYDHLMAIPNEEKVKSLRSYIDQPLHFAFMAIGVAFMFFIVWGSLAPMDSAAVAPGYIVSQSSNKMIQHQEGGVIERIMVSDGSEVHEDQVLIMLNDTAARAKFAMIKSQLRTLKAIEIRLNAEKDMMSAVVEKEKQVITPLQPDVKKLDEYSPINSQENKSSLLILPIAEVKTEEGNSYIGIPEVVFDDPIFDMSSTEVQKLLRTQNDLYQTNRRVIMSEMSVFHQRISQRLEENKGLAFQQKSLHAQLALLNEELKSLQSLSDKQLAAKSRLLDMKRRVEECKGSIGRINHEVSKNLEAITEDQSHITKTISDHFRDIYKELREAQSQVLDLQEQYRAASDVLARMEIKSPVDGYVTSLAYHTIGGVITTGMKIMEIVPKEDKLIVEARVSPRDIESIHVGLPSKIQLSAYKSKLVPRLSGVVVHVSADRISDPQNPMQPYYLAKVEIDQEELENLNYEVKLIPGMPAEVFIVKGERTMLQLLMSPLMDSFHKAFKES